MRRPIPQPHSAAPAASRVGGAKGGRVWKITEVSLKGAGRFPAQSFCPGHPIKRKYEAGSPFQLRGGNFISKSIPKAGLVHN